MNCFDFSQKIVLLIGCTGVLGSTFARSLKASNATLILADLPSSQLNDLANELQCPALTIDCLIEQSIVDCLDSASKLVDHIDCAIYNVAVTSEGLKSSLNNPFPSFCDYPLDLWNKTLAINLSGAFLFCREVSPILSANASVLLVSSIYGVVGPDHRIYQGESFNTFPGYSASKAGIIGLVRWLATLWGPQGIRINALSPGGVFNYQSSSFVEKYSNRTPMGRMASPSDISGPFLFLLSDNSSYITGQNIIVDGGLTAW